MTISNKTLISFVAAGALGLVVAPVTAFAAPDDVEEDVSEDEDEDIDVDIETDDDDDDDKGCTIATGVGNNIGGLLCTLGLVGWQLRRRRGA